VHVFGSPDAARAAAEAGAAPRLLCGEQRCLPPPEFDLGNSPGAFTPDVVVGRTIYLSTTNGTRALVAARAAAELFTGALVNASAVAGLLHQLARDVTLLCAGTEGEVSAEDLLGCGAVIDGLHRLGKVRLGNDAALIASDLFHANRRDLPAFLRRTRGGRNVIAAGLEPDIAYCAALDSLDVVGRCDGNTLVIRSTST
jgi:2-phosphosulfolactate phosphatase